jgi:hypothetical protein
MAASLRPLTGTRWVDAIGDILEKLVLATSPAPDAGGNDPRYK